MEGNQTSWKSNSWKSAYTEGKIKSSFRNAKEINNPRRKEESFGEGNIVLQQQGIKACIYKIAKKLHLFHK